MPVVFILNAQHTHTQNIDLLAVVYIIVFCTKWLFALQRHCFYFEGYDLMHVPHIPSDFDARGSENSGVLGYRRGAVCF